MNITPQEFSELAEHISDYLTEELDRDGIGYRISKYLIEDAMLCYVGQKVIKQRNDQTI